VVRKGKVVNKEGPAKDPKERDPSFWVKGGATVGGGITERKPVGGAGGMNKAQTIRAGRNKYQG